MDLRVDRLAALHIMSLVPRHIALRSRGRCRPSSGSYLQRRKPAEALADRPRSNRPSDAFATAFSFIAVELPQCPWRHPQCLE
jgi:hypothetical protein